MSNFLTDEQITLLSLIVRPEALEDCYKQPGVKDKVPHYNRPTTQEVRAIAKIIGVEGSKLGLLVGANGRVARRWQGDHPEMPSYSQWQLMCIKAATVLTECKENSNKLQELISTL